MGVDLDLLQRGFAMLAAACAAHNAEALGVRALACERFRWTPGMQTTDGDRVVDVIRCADGRHMLEVQDSQRLCEEPAGVWQRRWYDATDERHIVQPEEPPIPDIDDAATRGCLLWLLPDFAADAAGIVAALESA
jgi:hypothetical protein